jgi:hypothetical protein
LQKFHHIGAVVCWHLLYVYKVDGIWIPTLCNSFVHTIMYAYYLACLLQIRQVRHLRRYITSMQIIQLVTTSAMALYCYAPPVESHFNYALIIMFVGYASILFGLFSHFYYTAYLHHRQAT